MTSYRDQTVLAANGDVHDVRQRSGVPYHLLAEGRRAGLFQSGLSLRADPTVGSGRRWFWHLGRLLRHGEWGGYQLSVPLLEARWRPVQAEVAGATIVNYFQLFAPSVDARADVVRWFYLDQSLGQYLDGYGLRARVGHRLAADAARRERHGYQAAAGLIVHSRWAARGVVEAGADASRVHVIEPGANLDPGAYAGWEARAVGPQGLPSPPDGRLRLVFVGTDWRRKGLDRLLAAVSLARGRGARLRLRVVGTEAADVPSPLRGSAEVEWLGRIDKSSAPERFLHVVADNDVGCLLSRVEAAGISLREFHALGLGVLAPDVGGCPDQCIPEASRLLGTAASPEDIADVLLEWSRDPGVVLRLREAAWARRREMLWPNAVARMVDVMRSGRAARHQVQRAGP
jgi:glycosyltransferase involved in cell wall biosynthesis